MDKTIEELKKDFINTWCQDSGIYIERLNGDFNAVIQSAVSAERDRYANDIQEQPVKVKMLGIQGYIKMLKNNKGLVVGDVWLGEPNNPFDKSPVVIIDIKDGYVLYKYSTGGTSTEKISAFKRLYTKE